MPAHGGSFPLKSMRSLVGQTILNRVIRPGANINVLKRMPIISTTTATC